MFASRFFPSRFFAGRYWSKNGASIVGIIDVPGIEFRLIDRQPNYVSPASQTKYRAIDRQPNYISTGSDS